MTSVFSRTLLITLDHQRLLKVSGPDSEKFLQGQTTCDIRRLDIGAILPGAHCDHKGRMHSSFVAARLPDGSIGLRVHESIAESAKTALQKYAVFSKVELSVAGSISALAVLGPKTVEATSALELDLPAEDGHFTHHDQATVLRHSAEYFELWVPSGDIDAVRQALEANCEDAEPEQWDLAQIALGLGQVRAETVGEFIPQMLNFQATGAISFNKGCYTGQEVVARMHYLGKLKKHMYRAEAGVLGLPAAGAPVYSPESDSAVGTVVMAAQVKEGIASLLFVCAEHMLEGPLHVGSPDGPRLQVQPLPYSFT